MQLGDIKKIAINIKENINQVIIGKSDVIDLVLTSLFAGGHILLEDTPGTGKTVLAKSLAKSIDAKYNRIQFTPDLLPSDITGINIFNQKENKFEFIEGAVFTNILLADEINRATPRTQSSLLECMEEKQVTTDGVTRKLDSPFFVIATQNPIETAGTYLLPEAQLDRFMVQLSMGFPEKSEELLIMDRFILNNPLIDLNSVCTKMQLLEIRELIKTVFVASCIREYIVDLVRETRNNNSISLGISPRGTLAYLKAVQSYASVNGRDFVTPDDVKKLAIPIMAHRIICYEGYGNINASKDIIYEILDKIEVPTENWQK